METTTSVSARIGAALAAVALVFCTPNTAVAATDGTVNVRVKSAKSVTASAIHVHPVTKARTVAKVTANFTGHTTRSVKLTTFKLCYSGTPKRTETITPRIEVGGKVSWRGTTQRNVPSGTCRNWKASTVYSASPGKQMFALKTQLGTSKLTLQHRYSR